MATAAGAAAVGLKQVGDWVENETTKAANYSPQAAIAMMRTDLERELRSIRAGQSLGPKFAQIEPLRRDAESAFADTLLEIKEALLEFIVEWKTRAG